MLDALGCNAFNRVDDFEPAAASWSAVAGARPAPAVLVPDQVRGARAQPAPRLSIVALNASMRLSGAGEPIDVASICAACPEVSEPEARRVVDWLAQRHG